jgi:hypothetical protein
MCGHIRSAMVHKWGRRLGFWGIVEEGGWSEGLLMKFLGNLNGNAFLGTKTKLSISQSWKLV